MLIFTFNTAVDYLTFHVRQLTRQFRREEEALTVPTATCGFSRPPRSSSRVSDGTPIQRFTPTCAERHYWSDYMSADEDALSRCSTEAARWFIIPTNHKWFRNLAVARIVAEYLDGLLLKYPKPNVDIARIRHKFHGLRP
jgi:hypothetical protein